MAKDYIDYVVCKHEGSNARFLFRAPAWSYLEEGQKVIVETKKGPQTATVVCSYTDDNDPEDKGVKFKLASMGATWPLKKILSKIVVHELDYSGYEDDEEETDDQTTTMDEEAKEDV